MSDRLADILFAIGIVGAVVGVMSAVFLIGFIIAGGDLP